MKKTILVLEDCPASVAVIAQILREHGLRMRAFAASEILSEADENIDDIMELVAVSRKETALKSLIWHHLTNLTGNLLGPISTLSNVAGDIDLIVRYDLRKSVPPLKQAAEQLHESLVALSGMESTDGAVPCNLLKAVRQAEKAYKATLLDSNILLTVDVDMHWEVDLPAYLVSLVIATAIDNAQDAILEAEGGAGREIRIESHEHDGAIICHIINSGAIDGKDVPHIFEKKYTTKPHGRGMGLPLAVECLAIYNGELALTSAGPPETVFSLKLAKSSKVNPAREAASYPT